MPPLHEPLAPCKLPSGLPQLPLYLLAAACSIKSLPLQGQRGDIPRRLLPIMIEFSKLLSSEIFLLLLRRHILSLLATRNT